MYLHIFKAISKLQKTGNFKNINTKFQRQLSKETVEYVKPKFFDEMYSIAF